MGFSLNLLRVATDAVAESDRDGIRAWLAARRLELAPADHGAHRLIGPEGPLVLDGRRTDLHLDDLDQPEPVTGGIFHATLEEEECAAIYELCLAGRMLVVNPQGSPLFVVPGRTHEPGDLPPSNLDDVAWVDSPSELAAALAGDFAAFVQFRERALGHESP